MAIATDARKNTVAASRAPQKGFASLVLVQIKSIASIRPKAATIARNSLRKINAPTVTRPGRVRMPAAKVMIAAKFPAHATFVSRKYKTVLI